jgi:GNAT superfamily N-acetyltransferase
VAIRIELLSGHHDRKTFDCGKPSLNDWLARMALQQQHKNYARTRVAIEPDAPAKILGYSTLLVHEIDTQHFPTDRSLPKRLPCVLLGHLAVDQSAQGRKIGRALLMDAVERTRTTIAEAAGVGLLAEALDENAARFYRSYGFEPFRDDPQRLVLVVNWP